VEGGGLNGLPPFCEQPLEQSVCLTSGNNISEKCTKLNRSPSPAVRTYVTIRLECAAGRHIQDPYLNERFPVFTGEFPHAISIGGGSATLELSTDMGVSATRLLLAGDET
jgi:hypothetical protein